VSRAPLREARRAGGGVILLAVLLAAFAATWLAANGESPCGWGIFHP
jgi:hypothetical protein